MEIQTKEHLAKFIKNVRKKQNITQEQLSDFTGLQRIGIIKIEAAQTDPRLSTLLRIFEMLCIKLQVEFKGE